MQYADGRRGLRSGAGQPRFPGVAQNIAGNGLFRTRRDSGVETFRLAAYGPDARRDRRDAEGYEQGCPEVEAPMLHQAHHLRQHHHHGNGGGGKARGDDDGFPGSEFAFAVHLFGCQHSDGETAHEGRDRDDRGGAGGTEQGAHDGAQKHAAEFQQTIIHQKGHEENGHEQRSEHGAYEVIHDKGDDALVEQGGESFRPETGEPHDHDAQPRQLGRAHQKFRRVSLPYFADEEGVCQTVEHEQHRDPGNDGAEDAPEPGAYMIEDDRIFSAYGDADEKDDDTDRVAEEE